MEESTVLASCALSNISSNKNVLQAAPLILTPGDLNSNHLSLYIQFECVDIKESGTADNEVADNTNDYCSVTTALKKKTNHFPPLKTDTAGKGDIKQYNALH